ncbi:hypothetical protein F5Y08DRAFT_341255 [Xylaria arbuscula]|nr:hypothetical protein F5Y08DRAFT_341255 [Xylaria arbuscula]
MSASRTIQSLYQICDNIDSTPLRELPVVKLQELIQNESVAFRQPNSPWVQQMAEFYPRMEEVLRPLPSGKLPKESISEWKAFIHEWFILIDKLFFFGTLTKKLTTRNGVEQVINLSIENVFDNADLEIEAGRFTWRERKIIVYLGWQRESLAPGIHENSVSRVLFSLTHEAVHAFIYLFADNVHPRHREWIGDGHGPVFQEMLNTIAKEVLDITGRKSWAHELAVENWLFARRETAIPGSGNFPPRGFPPLPQEYPPRNYPTGNYPPEDYLSGGYSSGFYPPRDYPSTSYPSDSYPSDSYPSGGYSSRGYPSSDYPSGNYPARDYPPQNFPPRRYY